MCALSVFVCPGANARLEGVNKPELLPNSFTTVIDVAGFLTPGEVGLVQTKSIIACTPVEFACINTITCNHLRATVSV